MKGKFIAVIAACAILCMAGALIAGCKGGRDDALFCQDTVKQIALGDSPEEVESVLGEPDWKGGYLQNGMFLIERYEYYDSAYAALRDEYFGTADEAEDRSASEGRGEDLHDRLENTPYRFICVEFSGGSVRSVLLDQKRGGGVTVPKEPVSWELLEREVDAYTEASLIYTASYADGSYYLGRGSVMAEGAGEVWAFWTDAFGNRLEDKVTATARGYTISADGTEFTLLDANYGFDVSSYRSTLKKVTLADGTWLDGSVFEGFPVLEELVCGEGVHFESYCFEGCPLRRVTATAYHLISLPKADLEEVTVTEGDLMGGLFLNRKSLKTVTLEDVSAIGLGAFRGCEALESVYFAETEGWTADGVPLSEEALADNMKAAKYLRGTYADCVWERK